MRLKIFFISITVSILNAISETPKTINYQGLLKTEDGQYKTNYTYELTIKLIQDKTIIYTETHTGTTNSKGVFALRIGEGNSQNNNYKSINWEKGDISVETWYDNKKISETTLTAVPYALFANSTTGLDKLKNTIDSLSVENEKLRLILSNITEKSKNLFDKNAATTGKYIAKEGWIGDNSNYGISDYIPIIPGQRIALTKAVTYSHIGINLYNNEKKLISTQPGSDIITGINNSAFMRFTFHINEINQTQAEYGTITTPYQNFGTILALNNNTDISTNNIEAILPDTLYFAQEKTANLYFDNFITTPINKNGISARFEKTTGINYNRQFVITPTTESEIIPANLSIRQNNTLSKSYNLNYRVINQHKNKGKSVNLLFIGDSFTDKGTYVEETYTQITADSINVNLIGTTGTSKRRSEGLSGGSIDNSILDISAGASRIVHVEGVTNPPYTGYPGIIYKDNNGGQWMCKGYKLDNKGNGMMRFAQYGVTDMSSFPRNGTLTKLSTNNSTTGESIINYTDAVEAYMNPFINPLTKKTDFKYYINFWDFNTPDIVILQFAWNGLADWASDEQINTISDRAKTTIDLLHSDFPFCKIIFSIEPQGAINATTIDVLGKHYSILRFAKSLYNLFEDNNYSQFVKIAPSYAWVDRINGYGSKTTVLNQRYPDIIESTSTDPVHCNDNGMKQISDCLYPIIHLFLNNK